MRILGRIKLSLLILRQRCARGMARHLLPFFAPSFRAVSWAALATALAGCDSATSVVHSAKLDARPDMQCVKQAVASLAGVSGVKYLHASVPDKGDFDEITYQADDQHVMLMVEPDDEYRQTFLRLRGFGSDSIMPRMRRVMAQVDRTVEKACHVRHLSRKIRETCMNGSQPEGKCPPLAS